MISGFQVPQYWSLVQVGQIGHVLAFLKFWWIDLSYAFAFYDLFFMTNCNSGFFPIIRLKCSCKILRINKNKPERVFGLQVRWRELDTFKILEKFWEIFWKCFGFLRGIFGEFFGRIFWEDFFGEIFWEDFLGEFFLGGFFWEEFFVYIIKVI